MIAFLVAGSGLLVYLASVKGNAGVAFYSVLAVVAGLAVLAAVGIRVGTRKPPLARWLIWCWTPAAIVGLGGVAAIGAAITVRFTAGDHASGQTKTLYALVVAAVVAGVAAINGWVARHLAPWLATRAIRWRYGALFPCVPVGNGPGREAQEAITGPILDGPAIQHVLTKISAARAAGAVDGGKNWKCFDPPAAT